MKHLTNDYVLPIFCSVLYVVTETAFYIILKKKGSSYQKNLLVFGSLIEFANNKIISFCFNFKEFELNHTAGNHRSTVKVRCLLPASLSISGKF